MPYRYDCPLRWGDLDAQGHLNNAVFVDYLQEARVDFLMNGPLAGMLGGAGGGPGVLVAGHQVEYRRPVRYGLEPLPILLFVDEVGAARFSLGYRVGDPDDPAVVARTVLAPFDLTEQRILRLTPEQRAFFRSHACESSDLRKLPRVSFGAVGHRTELRVRWSDLDSYGHVNNVRFYDYVQEARLRMLLELPRESGVREVAWLVVRQDVDYLAQLTHRREPYLVRTVLVEHGRTSMTLAAEVVDADTGRVFAEARSVIVCADIENHRPKPIPNSVREALQVWSLAAVS